MGADHHYWPGDFVGWWECYQGSSLDYDCLKIPTNVKITYNYSVNQHETNAVFLLSMFCLSSIIVFVIPCWMGD